MEIQVTSQEHFERAVVLRTRTLRLNASRRLFQRMQDEIAKEYSKHANRRAFVLGRVSLAELPGALELLAADWRETEERVAALDRETEERLRRHESAPAPRFTIQLRPYSSAFQRHTEVPVSSMRFAYASGKYVATAREKNGVLVAKLFNRDSMQRVSTCSGDLVRNVFVCVDGRLELHERDPTVARSYLWNEVGVALPFLNLSIHKSELRIHNPSTDKYVVIQLETSGIISHNDCEAFTTPRDGRHYLRTEAGNGHPATIVSVLDSQLF